MTKEEEERYQLALLKDNMKHGLASPISKSALDVLFEQAWEGHARCGGFTMRLLIGEIYRLRWRLETHQIDPESGVKKT